MTHDEMFKVMMWLIGGLFSMLVGVSIYYLKKMVEHIEFLGDGQNEIRNSLTRIEVDVTHIRTNYENLSRRTDEIHSTVHEHSVKIARLEARNESKHKETA